MSKVCTFHPYPGKLLQSIMSPWPFDKWCVNILGPFPLALGKLTFIFIGVDYFTEWMEAKVVAKITEEKVRHFYCRSIIFQFVLPKTIVSENGTQLSISIIIELNDNLGIWMKFVSFKHPRANGQTEATNKVVLSGMKKKLDEANGLRSNNYTRYYGHITRSFINKLRKLHSW